MSCTAAVQGVSRRLKDAHHRVNQVRGQLIRQHQQPDLTQHCDWHQALSFGAYFLAVVIAVLLTYVLCRRHPSDGVA